MPLDFENTEIAFQSKSGLALRRAYWLFFVLAHPLLVWWGTRLATLAMNLRLPIQGLIRATIFRQFCGGTDLEECRNTVVELARFRIGTILDFASEGSPNEETFEATRQEILRTVDLAAGNPQIPFCVFKFTGVVRFGLLAKLDAKEPLSSEEASEWDRGQKRILSICQAAFDKNVRIFIDAEESWIQDTTDQIATEMMERFNRKDAIIFNTVQMYRKDRLLFLKHSVSQAESGNYFLGVKLVRGAYMEKERGRALSLGVSCPIFEDKASTDASYDLGLETCVENLSRISLCAGTHNETSTQLLIALMQAKQIEKNSPKIYFSQLLGMSDNLSYNLANAGFNVAKYMPYGPVQVMMPYLIRRAKENTAMAGQTTRELALVKREFSRRRHSS